MTPYAVSRYLKMSNNAIYCRVNRARKKYIEVFGDQIHSIHTDFKTNISKPPDKTAFSFALKYV